jgi:endoglycosylceramidase
MHRMNRRCSPRSSSGHPVVAGCSSTDDAANDGPTSTRAESTTTSAATERRPRHPHQPRIVDDQTGRSSGANVNSLGTAVTLFVPVVPASMISGRHGGTVQRRDCSPLASSTGTAPLTRSTATVADAIDAAAHGIYSVVTCTRRLGTSPHPPRDLPDGGDPAIGWDGAPEWATLTDGASTVARGDLPSRHQRGTVLRQPHGIMDELVDVGVRRRWPRQPSFDRRVRPLNEPNVGSGATPATDQLGRFYDQAITAIRCRGTARWTDRVLSSSPSPVNLFQRLHRRRQHRAAPHHYGSRSAILIEACSTTSLNFAAGYRTVVGGRVRLLRGHRRGGREARTVRSQGGRRPPATPVAVAPGGDPHSVGRPGGTSDPVQIHLQTNRCPGDVNGGVNPRWKCLWRPYPRATAGVITSLDASCDGALDYRASTPTPGTIEIWSPGVADRQPTVAGEGISDIDIAAVAGGFVVSATATGDYHVVLSPS